MVLNYSVLSENGLGSVSRGQPGRGRGSDGGHADGLSGEARGAPDVKQALAAEGRPVIVDGAIDYSKPTAFTLGTTQTTFGGFPLGQKLRFVKRMVGRRFFS